MSVTGVHFMAVDKAKEQLVTLDEQYAKATVQLDEAIKMGDLRENAEYDIAKALVQRLTRERESLSSVAVMPVVRANDNLRVIEEGSIVHVTIYGIAQAPVKPGSSEFAEFKSRTPIFDGVLMYGATLQYHDLLNDKALATDTPVGKFLLGKQMGDYCVPVPAGFACLTADKLKSTVSPDVLYCKL